MSYRAIEDLAAVPHRMEGMKPGRRPEALDECRRLLEIDPENKQARLLLSGEWGCNEYALHVRYNGFHV